MQHPHTDQLVETRQMKDIPKGPLRIIGLNRSRGRRCGARFAHYLDGNVLSEDGGWESLTIDMTATTLFAAATR